MTRDKKENRLKIGEVAKRLEIAVETIRMYESAGLIITEKTAAGQRIFNEADLHWLTCIRTLIKEKGLNLEGIRRLLALMPCWDLKPCLKKERKICPAFNGANQPCWTIKKSHPQVCRTADCRECNVYRGASQCTNLKALLYQSKSSDGK